MAHFAYSSLLILQGPLALLCISVSPAQALSPVTYVSGAGRDVGACATPASACRSFAHALAQTNPGGEIKALDPADYQPVIIDKSVSITGVKGAGVTRRTDGVAITIVAQATDAVTLSGLTIDGLGQTAWYGVLDASGGRLHIRNCTIRNYGGGIESNATRFLVEDTVVTNTNNGIRFAFSPSASKGALRRVTVTNNIVGALIGNNVQATVVDSVFGQNTNGLLTGGSGELRIAHSTVTGNLGSAIVIDAGSKGKSAGDNYIDGVVTGNLPIFGTW